MSKGFVWFALNNAKTDYVKLSERLGGAIKKYNKNNQTLNVLSFMYTYMCFFSM